MSEDLSPQPEPKAETPPEGPGAPADSVPNEPRPPSELAEPPRSAQVAEETVPDEIEKPEDVDDDKKGEAKPTNEEPAG